MINAYTLHEGRVTETNFAALQNKHTTVWLDLVEPEAEEWEQVATHVGVPKQELSDLLDRRQRPVLQDIGSFTVIVFHSVAMENGRLQVKPHLLLASKEQKDFISIHQESSRSAEKISGYVESRKAELFKKGATALLFAFLDELTGSGFEALDYISERVDRLEQGVVKNSGSPEVMKQVFDIKKQLLYLQRTLSADREVASSIEKAYGQFLDRRLLSQFRLLYSDLTAMIEQVTVFREIIISTVEIHLSAISNSLNMVMKRLTAWAAIILVPSLIAGIYGMNLAFLPFSKQDPEGFYYIIGLMAASVLILYGYFKSRDWI